LKKQTKSTSSSKNPKISRSTLAPSEIENKRPTSTSIKISERFRHKSHQNYTSKKPSKTTAADAGFALVQVGFQHRF
jgi:hypothetical protein